MVGDEGCKSVVSSRRNSSAQGLLRVLADLFQKAVLSARKLVSKRDQRNQELLIRLFSVSKNLDAGICDERMNYAVRQSCQALNWVASCADEPDEMGRLTCYLSSSTPKFFDLRQRAQSQCVLAPVFVKP